MILVSRLRKIAEQFDSSDIAPNTLVFPDDWRWVDNDDITKKQYYSNINREWEFEKMLDYPEWSLQQL